MNKFMEWATKSKKQEQGTPAPIEKLLRATDFFVVEKGILSGQADVWETRGGLATVDVFANGDWEISVEDIRERGVGVDALAQALRSFDFPSVKIAQGLVG